MPNRERVVTRLADEEIGGHVWNGRTNPAQHACRNAPACGLPADPGEASREVERVRAEHDGVYVRMMVDIDWNRVMLLAVDRHRKALVSDARHLDVSSVFGDDTEVPCGACVREAVLSVDFAAYEWKGDGTEVSPRALDGKVPW